MCWDKGLWTLSFGRSQFHGHGSRLVCEVALISLQGAGTWARFVKTRSTQVISSQPSARRSCPNLPGRNLPTRSPLCHATCPSWTFRAGAFQRPGGQKKNATCHSNGPVHDEVAPNPLPLLSLLSDESATFRMFYDLHSRLIGFSKLTL